MLSSKPETVNVFPEPVYPYASTEDEKPSKVASNKSVTPLYSKIYY